MQPIKISVDFDNTLTRPDVQEYIKSLINLGVEVWIVTARFDSTSKYSESMIELWGINDLIFEHNQLFEVAEELGIDKNHIIFMNMSPKKNFFINNRDFLFHLDDDIIELATIKYVNTVDVLAHNWIELCDNYFRNK